MCVLSCIPTLVKTHCQDTFQFTGSTELQRLQKSGAPITRDAASFHLFQALSNPSKRAEVVACGGAQTALCILADDSLPRDWTNAATLLRKLLFDEVNREPIARMRVTGRPATAVLISAVLSSVCTSNCQEAAAESLALTSAFPDSCAVCTSAAQQMSFWEPMARLMQDHKRNADVKAHMYVAEHCINYHCSLQTCWVLRILTTLFACAEQTSSAICLQRFVSMYKSHCSCGTIPLRASWSMKGSIQSLS